MDALAIGLAPGRQSPAAMSALSRGPGSGPILRNEPENRPEGPSGGPLCPGSRSTKLPVGSEVPAARAFPSATPGEALDLRGRSAGRETRGHRTEAPRRAAPHPRPRRDLPLGTGARWPGRQPARLGLGPDSAERTRDSAGEAITRATLPGTPSGGLASRRVRRDAQPTRPRLPTRQGWVTGSACPAVGARPVRRPSPASSLAGGLSYHGRLAVLCGRTYVLSLL